MIFDTDVLIWIQRGSKKAARAVDRSIDRYISIVTYMELLQAATNKKQHEYISDFLKEFGFQTSHFSLQTSEAQGEGRNRHRATIERVKRPSE